MNFLDLKNIKLSRYIDGLDSTMNDIIEIDSKIKILNIQIKTEIKQPLYCSESDNSDSDLDVVKKLISVSDSEEIMNNI